MANSSTELTTMSEVCFLCDKPLAGSGTLFACIGLCCKLCHSECAKKKEKLTSVQCSECSKPGQMSVRELSVRLSWMFPTLLQMQHSLTQLTGQIESLCKENRDLKRRLNIKSTDAAVAIDSLNTAATLTSIVATDGTSLSANVSSLGRSRRQHDWRKAASLRERNGRSGGHGAAAVVADGERVGCYKQGNPGATPPPARRTAPRQSDQQNINKSIHKDGNGNGNRGGLIRGSVSADSSTVDAAVAASAAGSGIAAEKPTVAVRTKKFFVSNLRPELTAEQVAEHLGRLGANAKTVHKLRTRRDTYASFCAVVNEHDLRKLCDPSKWISNIVFKEYRGTPHPDQIVHTHDGTQ